MKKIVFLLILGIAFGCKKKEILNTKNLLEKPYIISKAIIESEKINDSFPPPPPIPKGGTYGTDYFIITKNASIFYFKREQIYGFICGTGTENDTIPHFIDLKPYELVQIPTNSISDFVSLNIRKEDRNIIHITSQLDTLSSKNYYNLLQSLNNSIKDKDVYFIRRTTQEEDTVLCYLNNRKQYNFREIKWDETKINFKN